MSDGGAVQPYRGYKLQVTKQRENDMKWRAHLKISGKVGVIHRGDSGAHCSFLQAEAEASALARNYIDALVDEVSLEAAASQWRLPIR